MPPLGCLVHHLLEGRGACLGWRLAPEPAHQLNDIDRGGNGDLAQMGFAQPHIPRAAQAHRACALGMDPLNARPVAVGVLEDLRFLTLPPGQQGVHLLARA